MSQEPTWVTVDQVVAQNEAICRIKPEPFGVKDAGALASAVSRAQQHYHYGPEENRDDLILLGVKICVGISQAQAFVQGNKRTAVAAMELFYQLNGYTLRSMPEGEIADLVLAAAHAQHDKRISDEEFAEGILDLDPFRPGEEGLSVLLGMNQAFAVRAAGAYRGVPLDEANVFYIPPVINPDVPERE